MIIKLVTKESDILSRRNFLQLGDAEMPRLILCDVIVEHHISEN